MDIVVVCGIGLTALALALVFLTVAHERDFSERFPPITDDEFVAACSPGTSRHVALTVRRIVAEHLAVEYDRVHPSMSFIEDIGAD